ncbi:hypothetical protein ACFX5F_13810 [Flavobacterium sp. ZS1P70]|uniref:Uncharacterized protein n=1 Tax=Flavobacterium zhoui TaxID=3230414 RepID=A0ABW6I7Y5_9FLAO
MNLKNYKPLINLALLIVVAYILHKIIFYSFNIDDTAFHYSIEELYLLFSVLSVIVLVVLLKVKEQSFDNVGMSFLLSTSIKMVVCYLILRPVLQASGHNGSIEKKNFFAMFILFLAMETILTIRILNKNQ